VGFTPYYTVAIWFGFDKGGNSLGMNVNGESLAAPIWSTLLREYNQGLPRRDFPRPPGIVDAAVCRRSGKLPIQACASTISLSFLAGTIPEERCDSCGIDVEGLSTINNWGPWELPPIPDDLQRFLDLEFDFSSIFNRNPEEPEIPSDYDPLFD
jgi:membrane carboxypeptidase/penicillin-binding protein